MSIECLFILPIFHIILASCFLLLLIHLAFGFRPFASKPPSIYLVDFSCFKPPNSCMVPFSRFVQHTSTIGAFDNQSVEFMSKILASSELSEETYLPPAFLSVPPKTHQRDYIEEAEMILFPLMDDLFSKTKLSPQDVDILIINCSAFCPSPSLSSILVSKYSMRSDVKSFNLSGMGCSAGAIGLDLAQNLLKANNNSYAVVISTEMLSAGWYSGREKSMLVLNCLFRMGSAAALLTNKKEARKSSKYRLVTSLRTQTASEDRAYSTAIREEDSSGKLGVTMSKALLNAAGEILRLHVTILAWKILPLTTKLSYVVSIMRKKFIDESAKIYMPSLKIVIQHFCLPTSGKAYIREIQKGLKIEERDVEPALMTLHRFGNQSSSSMWYELAYIEAKQRMKKGDKVWLLGMGTGPKCNSSVWECLRPIAIAAGGDQSYDTNPWSDCIDLYPVHHHSSLSSKSPTSA